MEIKTLQRMRLGGAADAWSLTAIAAAFVASSPLFLPTANVPLMFGLAFLGMAYLTERYAFAVTEKTMLESDLNYASSDPPIAPSEVHKRTDALLFGYTTDHGVPIYIPYEDLTRHCLILGQSGSGKTVLGSTLMRQQIGNGGGLIFVDGKMSSADLDSMYQMCAEAGRSHDLLVINPGDPTMSNTYNPILYGDADEIGSRILSLIPDSSASPGADYFRQGALQAITTLVRGIKVTGKAYNFLDLSILMSNPKALMALQKLILLKAKNVSESDKDTKDSIDDILLFLNRFTTKTQKGVQFDVNKMKEVLGGIAGRLHSFGTGTFGNVLNSYNPDVNLYENILQNKIIYIMLPTMAKSEAATNMAKILMGDYRTAVSWIQRLPEHERPNPPTLVFLDEAGSYFNQSFSRLLEQARSARQMVIPAAQIKANFDVISEEMGEMVIGNTYTKVFFQLGTSEVAEVAATLVGMTRKVTMSVSDSDSESDSAQKIQVTPDRANATGQGLTIGMREEETYRIQPDGFISLKRGQCVVTYAGASKIYDIRVPMFTVDDELKKAIGPTKINRMYKPRIEGLCFQNKILEFVDQISEKQDEEGAEDKQ